MRFGCLIRVAFVMEMVIPLLFRAETAENRRCSTRCFCAGWGEGTGGVCR